MAAAHDAKRGGGGALRPLSPELLAVQRDAAALRHATSGALSRVSESESAVRALLRSERRLAQVRACVC